MTDTASATEAITQATTQLPVWIEYAKALGTPIAALIAAATGAYITHKFGAIQAGIAKRQADTAEFNANIARNKLKLDLLDRRAAVHKTLVQAISTVSTMDKFDQKDEYAYLTGTNGAAWLFDEAVTHYIEVELWGILLDFQLSVDQLSNSDIDSRGNAAANRTQKFRLVVAQLGVVESRLKPFLKIET